MKVEFARTFHDDMARIEDHLITHGAPTEERIAEILKALRILQLNPYIGREVDDGLRELVLGDKRAHRGYVALYDVIADANDTDDDFILMMAIRSQRESGYH